MPVKVLLMLAGLIVLIAIIALASLYLYSGTWPPIIIVNGNSMSPNLEDGDIVIVKKVSPVEIKTYYESIEPAYKSFGDFGDVIIFKPFGDNDRKFVIHRAMSYSMGGGTIGSYNDTLKNEGFMTKGDNNVLLDQDGDSEVSAFTPVKPEWVLGIAKHRMPTLSLL
jgi:signal peptidase